MIAACCFGNTCNIKGWWY